mmetsp:Transcript_4699/g.7261  ORF Transcript_4699/g.7261 Transcript_4699/m.7261 type:complete len:250 (+) Transcript_4699:149-898(+)|eukprot:CAMPEP_0201729220 /NCGR_PEP_ID=MMETSP0593-20130828/18379_1 /ASSEMBLY_ACC=CAM_ASM_000672 /TAXON_ID=267983 /ORGANISM="Skeletonema japonicum, Strain CCMP2506" /LENGTH=249 /DNA_ID=CAMNT_0048221531 /DNA_START=145 /DNA_END=894 /DNA_ORIENTATION=+
MFSNNYDPFDDFFGPSQFGSPFSSPYEQRLRKELARRQQMEAERRRNAELERRKLMELERAKEERRRELEMMRRQQQMTRDEEMRRKRLIQAQQRRARYSPGSIVLGPDGNLYRLISPTAGDEQLCRGEERFPADKQRFCASDESEASSDEQMMPAKGSDPFQEESESSSKSEEEFMDTDVCGHEDHFYDALDTHPDPSTDSVKVQHRLQSVKVEDVSDEEDEELKELHSIWRNKSPSPGQWMEPIEIE